MQVQETVENHLKSLLIKHFDPRKADSIFTEEGEVMPQVHVKNLILKDIKKLISWDFIYVYGVLKKSIHSIATFSVALIVADSSLA